MRRERAIRETPRVSVPKRDGLGRVEWCWKSTNQFSGPPLHTGGGVENVRVELAEVLRPVDLRGHCSSALDDLLSCGSKLERGSLHRGFRRKEVTAMPRKKTKKRLPPRGTSGRFKKRKK